MTSQRFKPSGFNRFLILLLIILIAGCGGGDSTGSGSSGGAASKFSAPLPKGFSAPLPDSDLTLTAKAIIDPGTAAARTIDLTVDLATGQVGGVIDRVSAGAHLVVIEYFINNVKVATLTMNANVIPGQNNPVTVSPALIQYVETVSDSLFAAVTPNATDAPAINIFDHYSALPGGHVAAAPNRVLTVAPNGAGGRALLPPGSLFVDSLSGVLYTADATANAIFVWNNAATVNGAVSPDRVIAGPATGLSQPGGIAFDPFRNILYVVNRSGEILIWRDAAALTGEVAPTAIVAGAFTGLNSINHPLHLDLTSDTLYIGNGAEVRVFRKLGQSTGAQDIAPGRIIQMAGRALVEVSLGFDATRDLLYLSSKDPNGTTYKISGGGAAAGAVAPLFVLAGPESGLDQTSAITVGANTLMALSQGGSALRTWRQADQKDGDASPTQILDWAPPASPTALYYVATQNANGGDAQIALDATKDGNGHGRVTSDLPGINCGTTCSALFRSGETVTLTAAADGDSDFTGWSGACTGTANCVVTIDTAKSVTATFALKLFPLSVSKPGTGVGTVTSNPPGIDCGPDCSEAYLVGTFITLTAAGDANSDFAGWSGACAGKGSCIVTMDAAKSAVATFNKKQFVLTALKGGTGIGTVTSSPAGINCGPACSLPYDIGAQVTLTAAANSDSTFIGWAGACAGNGSCSVTMDKAKSVTATFNLKSLGVSVQKIGNGTGTVTSPSGINCGTDCSQLFTINTSVTLTAAAAAGSTFTGWGPPCSGTGTCTVQVDAPKGVTATFTLQTFGLTLTKAGNGDGTVTGAGIYNYGTAVTVSATPAPGSTFAGWTGPNGAECGAGSVAVTAAKNCIATFTLDQETLTITKAGNGAGSFTGAGTYNFGATATVTQTAGTGSTFTGWSGPNGTECAGGSVLMTAAKSCIATFTLNPETLTITVGGTGSGTVTGAGTYNYGTVIPITATPASGSTFAGWTGATDCVDGSVAMTANKSCVATFTLNRETLTITQAGNGAGTVTGGGGYDFGAVATVSAAPAVGSTFAGWSGPNSSECAAGAVTMDANKSCVATFTLNQETLTITTAGNGSGTVSGAGTYNYGTVVAMAAAPSTGSTFAGWSGDAGCVNGSVTMNANKACTATFTLDPETLTITKEGNGSGNVTGAGTYNYGTRVAVSEAAATGSTFTGWTGADGAECATGTVAMTSAKSCIATFRLNTTLTITKAGTGSGTVTGAGTYAYGTVVHITATPANGSTFDGWSGAADCTDGSVTMNNNKTCTATFTANPTTTTTVTVPATTTTTTVSTTPSTTTSSTVPSTTTTTLPATTTTAPATTSSTAATTTSTTLSTTTTSSTTVPTTTSTSPATISTTSTTTPTTILPITVTTITIP